MKRGWQVEPFETQGRACLNVDPLEPSQINLLKVQSRDIWQVPKSQDRKDREEVAW